MERDWYRNAIVELIGTFTLIFVGAGATIAIASQASTAATRAAVR